MTVDLPHNARRIDPHAARDAGATSWERAKEADTEHVSQTNKKGRFSVEFSDGEQHDVILVEDGHGFAGACDCNGFAFHEGDVAGDGCAHLYLLCQMGALNEHLIPTVDDVDVVEPEDMDVEVIGHGGSNSSTSGPEGQTAETEINEGEYDGSGPIDPSDVGVAKGEGRDLGEVSTLDERAQEIEDPEEFVKEISGVPPVFVIQMGRGKSKKPYVTKEGLNYIGQKQGIETWAEEISPSWEDPTEVAAYRGFAKTHDGRTFKDVGTAHRGNETVDDGDLDELASTRATNRALRLATGCGFASAEEIDGSIDPDLEEDVVDVDGAVATDGGR